MSTPPSSPRNTECPRAPKENHFSAWTKKDVQDFFQSQTNTNGQPTFEISSENVIGDLEDSVMTRSQIPRYVPIG